MQQLRPYMEQLETAEAMNIDKHPSHIHTRLHFSLTRHWLNAPVVLDNAPKTLPA